MKIVVTGGAGFIGSAVVRHLVAYSDHEVLVVDKLTYAGNLASLNSVQDNARYHFSQSDICDRSAIRKVFADFNPDAVMHLVTDGIKNGCRRSRRWPRHCRGCGGLLRSPSSSPARRIC